MATMEELFIVDNEYLDNYTSVMELMKQAEDQLKAYCSTLASLRAERVMLGETAASIEDFGITLASSISDILSSAGRIQKESMFAYIGEIDAADEALY